MAVYKAVISKAVPGVGWYPQSGKNQSVIAYAINAPVLIFSAVSTAEILRRCIVSIPCYLQSRFFLLFVVKCGWQYIRICTPSDYAGIARPDQP